MKIAIISDVHDNLINLEKCLNWCEKNNIKKIICCGDIANSETLEFLSKNFFKTIHLIRGNMEIYNKNEVKNYKNIKYYGRTGVFKLENKKIGLCHEPFFIDSLGKRDIIFYGHTHKPWESEKNGIKLINPGTLGGVFQKAAFAVWNTENDNMELKILEEI